MRRLPLVAIVGRPNVGKSTLFNRFCGYRKALVHDKPGLTRDRNYGDVSRGEMKFRVVDTGGLLDAAEEKLLERGVGEQAFAAMAEAQLILFVVDARAGVTPLDEEIAAKLRKQAVEVLLVVNKVDVPAVEPQALDFYRLGFEHLIRISAEHKLGLQHLEEMIFSFIELRQSADTTEREQIRLAIVGRPNAGKSTLVNRIIGEQRVLVSPIPGTTRDAVDVGLSFRKHHLVLVDTAGIRKKSRVHEVEENLSVTMAIRQIERSDVAILVLDATAGFGTQDASIAGIVEKSGKGVIIAINKWDLMTEKTHAAAVELVQQFRDRMPFLHYAPVHLVSALEGTRIVRLLDEVIAIVDRMKKRIPTAVLNRWLRRAVAKHSPPRHKGREVKLYYGTQVGEKPPTFSLHLNRGAGLHTSYERYLMNSLRSEFDFEGVPIRLREVEKRRRSNG